MYQTPIITSIHPPSRYRWISFSEQTRSENLVGMLLDLLILGKRYDESGARKKDFG